MRASGVVRAERAELGLDRAQDTPFFGQQPEARLVVAGMDHGAGVSLPRIAGGGPERPGMWPAGPGMMRAHEPSVRLILPDRHLAPKESREGGPD